MKIKVIIGAGYGDEGKGLLTDYYCGKEFNKTLNIKVNGGAQAGHTVCRFVDKKYMHWIFKQYGSGTFAGADTLLPETFMLNINELIQERDVLKEVFYIDTKMYINTKCRVTLPIHIWLNRYIENKRTNRHGSCGLGIYETFHMYNDFKKITLQTLLNWNTISENRLLDELNKLSTEYLDFRIQEIETRDNIKMTEHEYDNLIQSVKLENTILKNQLIQLLRYEDVKIVNTIQDIVSSNKNDYVQLVFECSQGLELDMNNTRNFPHLTPSNTGLTNIIKIMQDENIDSDEPLDVTFVTRSYKTKHGAGLFIEEDKEIQQIFGLYDRTNTHNEHQGTLMYGVLNIPRIKRLIVNQESEYIHKTNKEIKTNIAITHLDQTNSLLLTDNGSINISEITNETFGINGNILKSYGEKATDIIE